MLPKWRILAKSGHTASDPRFQVRHNQHLRRRGLYGRGEVLLQRSATVRQELREIRHCHRMLTLDPLPVSPT